MPDDGSKTSSSQIGAILAGIAAIIVACGGVYQIVHHEPNPPSPSASSLPAQVPTTTKVEPASSPRPLRKVIDPPPTPVIRRPTPFQIDGYWTGEKNRFGQTWVLNLGTEDGKVSGSSTDLNCEYPNIGPQTFTIKSGTWDGQSLSFVIDLAELSSSPKPAVVRYSLEKKDGNLAGATTYGRGVNVIFHSGRKPCPMPIAPEQ